MNPSDTLIEGLLGIVEGVAAYGDNIESPEGDHLAAAAREVVDHFWDEVGDYPAGARAHRDQIFTMLLNTRPVRVD